MRKPKYQQLAETMLGEDANLLWLNRPLETEELAKLAGREIPLDKIRNSISVSDINQTRLYLNQKLRGKHSKQGWNGTGKIEPKDLQIFSYERDHREWYKTFIPVNGRKDELIPLLKEKNENDKLEVFAKAGLWNDNNATKQVRADTDRQNAAASLQAKTRSLLQGVSIQFQKLESFTQEKVENLLPSGQRK